MSMILKKKIILKKIIVTCLTALKSCVIIIRSLHILRKLRINSFIQSKFRSRSRPPSINNIWGYFCTNLWKISTKNGVFRVNFKKNFISVSSSDPELKWVIWKLNIVQSQFFMDIVFIKRKGLLLRHYIYIFRLCVINSNC